ncbi:hypothetical protein BDF14DRAFT_1818527 [Spinellus fusiger]|nr:hypothetical protein BDF14DRAFT_1818527 [Spinellus fusiger]
MTLEIVYAIHDFDAENEDEITFAMGEPIVVLEKDEKYMDGWWQGRNRTGQVGLFPMNYTNTDKPTTTHTSETSSYASSYSVTDRYGGTYSLEDEIDHAISQVQTSPEHYYSSKPSEPPFRRSINRVSRMDYKQMSPEQWTVEHVADWLASVGLETVADNFIDQEITGDVLLDLNVDALKELGISTFGKRHKVMQAITALQKEMLKQPTVNVYPTPKPVSTTHPLETATQLNGHLNAQLRESISSPPSPIDSEGLYQYPRKAPLPPLTASEEQGERPLYHLSPPPRPQQETLIIRPASPQSIDSSNISRSNTFNTMSSKKSTTSNSTSYSGDRSVGHLSTLSHLGHSLSTVPTAHPQKLRSLDQSKSSSLPMSSRAERVSEGSITLNSATSHSLPLRTSNPHTLSVSSVEPDEACVSTEAAQAPEHEGWLHKQSDKYKTWNKRWFVLKGIHLFYFKSPKDVRMKGIVNLRNYRVVVDPSIHSGKYCFKAQHDKERTFFFYTDNEEAMRVWIKMLMKATITRDFQSPVMSSNHIATVPLEVARRMRPRPPSVIMYKNQLQNKQGDEVKMTIHEEEEQEEQEQEQEQEREEREEQKERKEREEREDVLMPCPSMSDSGSSLPRPSLSSSSSSPMHTNSLTYSHTINKSNALSPPRHSSQRAQKAQKAQSILSSKSGASSTHPLQSREYWSRDEYIHWVNARLPETLQIMDLSSGLQEGYVLVSLLQSISQETLSVVKSDKKAAGATPLDALAAAFQFMTAHGVRNDGMYTLKDIFTGNETKMMNMIDALREWEESLEQEQLRVNDRKVSVVW